ncbi:50S ribosomal protein L10 [bacterium]|nr:50S ribosomal protein L10 [bacterium]
MPSQKNTQNLDITKEKIARAKSVLVVDYAGVPVNDLTAFRRDLKKSGGEFFVTKNTLIGLSFDKKPEVMNALSGMNALILSYDDEVGAVKVTYDFIKDKEKMNVKVGYLDGQFLTPDQAEALSKIPGKTELLSALARTLNGPATNLVGVLKANVRDLTYVLYAIADKKEKEA